MPANHRALGGCGDSAQAGAYRQRLEGLLTFGNLRTREVVAAMMPLPIISNEEPAARIRHGGFSYLFSTATTGDDDDYHDFEAARNCA